MPGMERGKKKELGWAKQGLGDARRAFLKLFKAQRTGERTG